MAGLVVVVVAYCLNIPVAKWEIYVRMRLASNVHY